MIVTKPVFFFNGIKNAKGEKLQKAFYSLQNYDSAPHAQGTLTIYAKHYRRFTGLVREVFEVNNDSDYMTDYFSNDMIRVAPSHPLYADVLAAYQAQEAHREATRAKWEAKRAARLAA